jgi:DNA replication initiation complex subunit (GINS family)
MKIDYDEVRRIHRLEKNNNSLVDVEEDFFDSLNVFMMDEKKQYLEGLKNLSTVKARDYTNLKKMVEEIFMVRERKLLNKALISSRTGELSESKIALQEKKTLEELLKSLNSHRDYLEEVFGEQKEKKARELSVIEIKIMKDLPSFVGVDMNEYGPVEKDNKVKLPFKVANLLISRELAVKG